MVGVGGRVGGRGRVGVGNLVHVCPVTVPALFITPSQTVHPRRHDRKVQI